jgi:glycosyltransferase involved in cell wall biosynthesis
MKCPTLDELPPAPSGKMGWPWTEASQVLANSDLVWPRISLVTPNYNLGNSLEETIRSVLLQGYPNLEYILMDGGSTDQSVAIIQKYEPWLTFWVSQRDRGQTDALNQGLSRCTGDLANWLCSDDILLPGALHRVGQAWSETQADIVAGACRYLLLYKRSEYSIVPSEAGLELLECQSFLAQPSCFFSPELLQRIPPLDESFNYTMDYELWCSFKAQGAKWTFLSDFLAEAHEGGANKSAIAGEAALVERLRIYERYVQEPIPLTFWYKLLRHPILLWRHRHPDPIAQWLSWPVHIAIILLLSPFYGLKRVRSLGWTYD